MNMFCEVFMYVHYRIYSFLEKIIMQWNTTYTEKLFVTSKNMYILMNLRENEFASNWLPKMRFVALGNNYWPIPKIYYSGQDIYLRGTRKASKDRKSA